ncbi:hypothetical protein [Acetobacter ascendens]|nr:hypothetical protein [Acetobacter ascendens]
MGTMAFRCCQIMYLQAVEQKKESSSMMPVLRKKWLVLAGVCAVALPVLNMPSAMAEEGLGDDDDAETHRPADMHKLATKPPLPRAHKDFSKYRYKPEGDKVQEQPDANRLLFWTQDGKPDGYAQRRGSSIIYYNAQGQAIRIQHLTPEEMAD